jgi:hypothetical protein
MDADPAEDILSNQLKRVTAAVSSTTPLMRAPAKTRVRLPDLVRARTRFRRARYLYGLGLAVAVAVIVPLVTLGIFPGTSSSLTRIHLPGLTITALAQSQATAHLTAQQAASIASAYLAQDAGNLHFTGYSITATPVFEPEVTDVAWQCGSYSQPTPENVWIVEANAPAQQGWNTITAVVLVEDDSGQSSWFMARSTNSTGTDGTAISSTPQHGTVTSGSRAGCQ